MTVAMAVTLTKRPNEVRTYVFDFSEMPEIKAGDTLTGTPTITQSSTPSNATALTIASIKISADGKKVTAVISSGSSGGSYVLTCQCGTTQGSTLVGGGDMLVNANT